jgi:hypothetical protein
MNQDPAIREFAYLSMRISSKVMALPVAVADPEGKLKGPE